MSAHRSVAIVLGASISGLLAARALSDHFNHVTIIERDVLPDDATMRKGVPQSAHAHGLLASGYRVMDDYFPGMINQLQAQGTPYGDVVGDFLWFQYGRWKLRYPSGLRGITISRPCLEGAIRSRLRALPNITFLEGVDRAKPMFDPATGRVTGVLLQRVSNNAEERLRADLVVDASGRGSQSPKWLQEWGFGQPKTIAVKVDVGYATRVFERRPGEFFDSLGAIIASTPPSGTRLAAVLAVEANRWIVTLVGMVGDHPPVDVRGWEEFAATLPVSAVHDLVTSARPLTDVCSCRFPANQRRLYEQMTDFPQGYLVMGDAVCSFNPIYGQGMSVAATQAKALGDILGAGNTNLARRFYARARKVIDNPWAIATGEDLRYPQVQGKRSFGTRIVNRYLERVHAAAAQDATVCGRFFDVVNLLEGPASLMSPSTVWRVLRQRPPSGSGSPWGNISRSV